MQKGALMKKFLSLLVCTFTLLQANEIVFHPEMNVVGIACRTSNDNAMVDIPLHWARFFSENIADQIPNKATDEVVALYCDYESDHNHPYTLIIGCKTNDLSEVPEGLEARTIPSSQYAQFQAKGTFPESLINTWINIWQTDLPRTYTGDFEVYGEAFTGPERQVDVFIAIE